MKYLRWAVLVPLLLCIQVLVTGQNRHLISVSELPALPGAQGDAGALGYAGMVGGATDGFIVAAGGANFPRGAPWEGGPKVYSDRIYILAEGEWREANQRLPTPLAYSATVTTARGMLVIGGETGSSTSDRVFLMIPKGVKDVEILQYPSLPEPLAYSAAELDEGYVYVVGGKNDHRSVNSFYRLSLADTTADWEGLPDLPGQPRALHSAAVQQTGTARMLFVVGGRNQVAGDKSETLTSCLAYDLREQAWRGAGELTINGLPVVRMGGAMVSSGSMHLLLYGGSDEVLFNELEELGLQLGLVQTDSARQALLRRRAEIMEGHPGFSNRVLAYNTITERWFRYDSLDVALPVTALSFQDGGSFIIVSGEVSPGVRTSAVRRFELAQAAKDFGWINYTVLALYLLISVLIGVYFSRKQHSTEDYFTGGGRIPWWAAGLSVFGTLLSAITFMAIPAKAFTTDWSFFMLNITAILITPVIALLFIPFFNRLRIRTAYEYLEQRFNYTARAFGSLSFILFQLGRIGIVLLLPSLAISIVTGIPVETSIIIMGLLCIIYTTFGGIEAVIWTDVMQVIVLMGGSLLAVAWILMHTDHSVGEMIAYASERDKFNVFDMRFNFTESTFWVVFIGGLASAMITQGTDQTIVQRYLTSDDVQDSQRTLYTNAVLTLPATFIFFSLGTLLFMFYTENPQELTPGLSNNDSIFPLYIVNELPVGVSGLLVAGIFSAAMSSISSSLNSVSTAYSNDIHAHYRPETSDRELLRVARYATVITGVMGVLFALWMANSDIKSLWDEFYRFLGLFTGGLGGLFLLGMLTQRANAQGALSGLVVSGVVIWYVSFYTEINFLMYAFIGVATCFVFGYLCSLLWPEGVKESGGGV